MKQKRTKRQWHPKGKARTGLAPMRGAYRCDYTRNEVKLWNEILSRIVSRCNEYESSIPLTHLPFFYLKNFFIPILKPGWVRALGLGMCALTLRIDTLFMTKTPDRPYKGFPSPGRWEQLEFKQDHSVSVLIIRLAPRAGKMNRISRCDWLPERARWSYLARSGYGLCPASIIYHVLVFYPT